MAESTIRADSSVSATAPADPRVYGFITGAFALVAPAPAIGAPSSDLSELELCGLLRLVGLHSESCRPHRSRSSTRPRAGNGVWDPSSVLPCSISAASKADSGCRPTDKASFRICGLSLTGIWLPLADVLARIQ